jgi:hypothetical protein
MAYLAEKHRDWLCYKLADTFTSGIPDVHVAAEGMATWLELKVLRPKQSVSDRIKMRSDRHAKLQLHDMCKIEDNGVNAAYLFFFPLGDLHYVVLKPSTVKEWVDVGDSLSYQELYRDSYDDFVKVSNFCGGEYSALQF